MALDTESVIPNILILGTQDAKYIRLTFTLEQYTYVKESLVQAYQKRMYYREYSKKYHPDQRNIQVKPALLLYTAEPTYPQESIYYENVKAALRGVDEIEVNLDPQQYLYLRTVLQRRHGERVRQRLKSLSNRPDAKTRNVHRVPSVLIDLVK